MWSENGDIYCNILIGANIRSFEAYCCIGVTLWGGNWEQNIVCVTLVVQNVCEIFFIEFVGLSEIH